jgi:hypothetical protein
MSVSSSCTGRKTTAEVSMRYVDFRDVIGSELRKNPAGLTWVQLKDRLDLPYGRPCPSWVNRLEQEIGLTRARGIGRALLWKLRPRRSRQGQRKSGTSENRFLNERGTVSNEEI